MISPQKQQALSDLMHSLDILESDLEESFVTGSKKGGQKQNKTSSCVVLKHKPTKRCVKCQKTRSLTLNRYYARYQLCEQIQKGLGVKNAKHEKIRKQKKRRARKASLKNSDLL